MVQFLAGLRPDRAAKGGKFSLDAHTVANGAKANRVSFAA